jgi:CheY-like chemotaxis protein
MNLVGNSIKFTEQGTIIVRVSRNNQKDKTGNILFEVIDTGIGISEEQKEKLFKPYSQIDSSSSKSYGGTGLGLSISKNIVEMMGGEIWLESTPGLGTKISFTLLCEEVNDNKLVSEDKNIKKNNANNPNQSIANILLVDDSEFNRILIKEYLKHTKHIIVEAQNGQDALEKIKNNNIDIVLMDMQMPVMDGYTATKEIRKWELATNHLHTPIIAVTAYAMKEEQEKSLAVGCDQHISKPISKESMINVLNQLGLH